MMKIIATIVLLAILILIGAFILMIIGAEPDNHKR